MKDSHSPEAGPLFSVVTISLNQAEFLARAIDSVVGQQGVRIQYIICDPGSGDGSRDIIDSYGNAIDVRIYEPDRGPADGLNRGFAHATGDIYAYLNSDDTFLPGAFAEVAAHFAERPETDVLVGHSLATDRHDRVLRRIWSVPYRPRFVAYGVCSHLQPSTFFRARAFRRTAGFNPANRYAWDGELLLDMFLSGARIEVIDSFLSTYRLHGDSITNTGTGETEIRRFFDDRFFRLIGREPRRYDALISRLYWLWTRTMSPRIPIERLRGGRIYKRGAE